MNEQWTESVCPFFVCSFVNLLKFDSLFFRIENDVNCWNGQVFRLLSSPVDAFISKGDEIFDELNENQKRCKECKFYSRSLFNTWPISLYLWTAISNSTYSLFYSSVVAKKESNSIFCQKWMICLDILYHSTIDHSQYQINAECRIE